MRAKTMAYNFALYGAQILLAVSLSYMLSNRAQERHYELLLSRSEVNAAKADALLATMQSMANRMLEDDARELSDERRAKRRGKELAELRRLRDQNVHRIAALERQQKQADKLLKQLYREPPCR